MADIEAFRNRIIEAGTVLDPAGVHSEFVSGMHGQKLDFDNIPTGSPLYNEWTDVAAEFIQRQFPAQPFAILGVANGTNRTAVDTAKKFNGQVEGLVSEKDEYDSKVLRLSTYAADVISAAKPELVIVLEDVGTTGSNSVQVALGAEKAGARQVVVVSTWKRREHLEKLDDAGVRNVAIIDEPLPTYSESDCKTLVEGFCARGWKFKPRQK